MTFKPKSIKKIEQLIGKELEECAIDFNWGVENGYELNQQKQIVALNLSHTQITNLSALQAALTNLTELDLSGNEIYYLNVLEKLTNLTYLKLNYNRITDLSGLKALINLTELYLNSNQITDLGGLQTLTNLTKLYLNSNQITDSRGLKALTHLTTLDLSHNQIIDLSGLQTLTNLTYLKLNDNQITDLSALQVLTNLTYLDLSDNQITDLNGLQTLTNLKYIDLSDNQVIKLPEWLLDFNLGIIWQLQLKGFVSKGIFLEGNPLQSPPPEIIKQGNEAIKNYFKQLKEKDIDYIYEAKLILVGEGGAGKTSLANKIINPDYELIPEPDSIPTQGIDIFSYSFPYKDKNFQVNIWDFGGQEIYHQTHQFFLTKRSLYLFVVDSRRDNPNLDYWFKMVELLSDNSPLLIIKNEKQNCLCEIQENQLKAEFINIKDSLATNLSDNRGLNPIIDSLKHFITQLPHIGSPLPKTWVKVRQQLEQDSRHYIDLKEYFDICQTNGFEKETDKLQLSGYLHDLGVCLHFQEDEESPLYKTIILKPTWATDAVYKVLDNAEVIRNFGRFNKNDLKNIWQDAQYNTMRGELLALMQKFKLCYEIPNQPQHYIAPQLLEQNPPAYTWQADNNLLLRYQYDFMPKGIISQFIVIMHQYIAHDYQTVWKNGVVLEKDNTQTEIIEYYKDRQIHIRVQGQNKKELLTIVSHELDKINNSYPRLETKCDKLTPCKCTECQRSTTPYFHQYKVLMKLKQKTTQAQCQKSGDMVNILELIDDINLTGFKNLSGLASKQTIIQINTGDDIMSGDITNTNISIGGNVTNSTISGRDSNIQTNQGMSKDELLVLLTQFKELLQQAKLNEDTVEVIHDDINSVEKQLNKSEPNKSIVSNKLESINGLLEDANNTMDTAEKANETFSRLMGVWGNIYPVVSNLSGLLP